MRFQEFSEVFGDDPIIDIRNVITYFDGLDRRRLYEWQQRGWITKVANNFYVMTNRRLDGEVLKCIGCKIYEPAYIGLHSALSWYTLIPEAVFQTIAITTRRSKHLKTPVGEFRYRSIKSELFFGIRIAGEGNKRFYLSDPEKTLLDYLYFVEASDQRDTIEGMRLNFAEIERLIEWPRLNRYLQLFSSPKVERAARQLREMTHAQYR